MTVLIEDLFWTKKFNEKRNEKERDKILLKICNNKTWILEGVYITWIEIGIKKSDLVILLKPSLNRIFWRITRRTIKRKKSKNLGNKISEESWKDYLGLLKAARNYYKKAHPRGYFKHKELINKHKVNFVILKTNKEINNFFEDLIHP